MTKPLFSESDPFNLHFKHLRRFKEAVLIKDYGQADLYCGLLLQDISETMVALSGKHPERNPENYDHDNA